MLHNTLRNRRTGGLVLAAGLAAFALYRYYKMSAAEKSNLTKTLKEKGKSLLGPVIPGGLRNVFGNGSKNKTYSDVVM